MGRARPLLLGCALLLAAATAGAVRQATWSTPDLLRAFFPSSASVGFVEVAREELPATAQAHARDKTAVFVARSGATIDGYAVIDDERGQHEPITFGVRFSPDGTVTRVEVMAYREAFGGGIRDGRFLQQLVGKTSADALRVGSDIDGVTGATISSRSTAAAVRRALALVDVARRKTASR